jgi:hypothetical protein
LLENQAGTPFAQTTTVIVMSDNDARRQAISVWLMEFSVLWAVFPLLDQLVDDRAIDVRIMAWSLGMTLTAFALGVILTRGQRK